MIHWHVLLFPTLLLESLFKSIGPINQFLHQFIGGKYVYTKCQNGSLIHHQGIICGVAFDRSSLRRIAPYASVVAPRRLASNALLVIRNTP